MNISANDAAIRIAQLKAAIAAEVPATVISSLREEVSFLEKQIETELDQNKNLGEAWRAQSQETSRNKATGLGNRLCQVGLSPVRRRGGRSVGRPRPPPPRRTVLANTASQSE